jgi:hypothetical protein
MKIRSRVQISVGPSHSVVCVEDAVDDVDVRVLAKQLLEARAVSRTSLDLAGTTRLVPAAH